MVYWLQFVYYLRCKVSKTTAKKIKRNTKRYQNRYKVQNCKIQRVPLLQYDTIFAIYVSKYNIVPKLRFIMYQ